MAHGSNPSWVNPVHAILSVERTTKNKHTQTLFCVCERESPVKKGKEFLFFPFALARQKAIFARPLARRLLREEILPLPRGRRSSQTKTKNKHKKKNPQTV